MSVSLKHRSQYDEDLTSSDSDDYFRQAFFSSSSHDRSSVGSIPWAEDAIKQNQQEWLRIERMFYGEEELPHDDVELRREIIEWTTVFPHLRVVGRKLTASDAELSLRDELVDRTPSTNGSVPDSLPDIDERFNKGFIIHPEAKSILLDMNLSRLLDRDLRIHSVPMVSKRKQLVGLSGTQRANMVWERPVPKSFQPRDPPRKFIKRQTFPSESCVSTLLGIGDKLNNSAAINSSRSARIVRMPPIVNFILPAQTKYLPSASAANLYLSAADGNDGLHKLTQQRQYRPIVLPVLKINREEVEGNGGSRSISAVVDQGKLRPMYLTNSASKLKISK